MRRKIHGLSKLWANREVKSILRSMDIELPRLLQRKKQLAILERLPFDAVMDLEMRPVVGHGTDSFLGETGFELAAHHIIKPQAIGITLCEDACSFYRRSKDAIAVDEPAVRQSEDMC